MVEHGILTTEGALWGFGQNDKGQLGINCTGNTSYPMKTAVNVVDMSLGAKHTAIRKIGDSVYVTGHGESGRLGTGNASDAIVFTNINISGKPRYIIAGNANTTIVKQDGNIYTVGNNSSGELGTGNTTNYSQFMYGKTSSTQNVENALYAGKNNGDAEGYGLNTTVILENGDVYTAGNNNYGQIGDNTEEKSTYFKKMGSVGIEYDESLVEVGEAGYQIDVNKIKVINSTINVYESQEDLSLGTLKYTSMDENMAKVSEGGFITVEEGQNRNM